jgi:hypothetical protein
MPVHALSKVLIAPADPRFDSAHIDLQPAANFLQGQTLQMVQLDSSTQQLRDASKLPL